MGDKKTYFPASFRLAGHARHSRDVRRYSAENQSHQGEDAAVTQTLPCNV